MEELKNIEEDLMKKSEKEMLQEVESKVKIENLEKSLKEARSETFMLYIMMIVMSLFIANMYI